MQTWNVFYTKGYNQQAQRRAAVGRSRHKRYHWMLCWFPYLRFDLISGDSEHNNVFQQTQARVDIQRISLRHIVFDITKRTQQRQTCRFSQRGPISNG